MSNEIKIPRNLNTISNGSWVKITNLGLTFSACLSKDLPFYARYVYVRPKTDGKGNPVTMDIFLVENEEDVPDSDRSFKLYLQGGRSNILVSSVLLSTMITTIIGSRDKIFKDKEFDHYPAVYNAKEEKIEVDLTQVIKDEANTH